MRQTRVSLVAALLLLATVARAEQPAADPANVEAGKRAFAAGLTLLQDPEGARYDEALLQFRRAYELTGSWKALGNLALCLFKLERDGEAIDIYEKYLELAGKRLDPADRAQVERDVFALKAQVVTVELEFPEAGATLIDERTDARGGRIVNEYQAEGTRLALRLHPGRHVMTAKLSAGDARWETRLEPASSVAHKFELVSSGNAGGAGAGASATEPGQMSIPETPRDGQSTKADLRIPAYASFGVAALGIGVGTLFVLKSKDSREQADSLCNGDQCPVSKRDEISGLQEDANAQGQLAWIGFVAFGVGAAAGVTLLVIGGGGSAESASAARVSAFVGLGGAGVAGRF